MNEVVSITKEPKIAEKVQRWEAFWSLEDVGRPLWMIPTSPVVTSVLVKPVPWPRLLRDKVAQLEGQLALLAFRESIGIDDDFIPHLQPQGGVTVFASAFGCDVEFFNHTLPWAHPVIKADDPAERVYDLTPPPLTAGQLGEMLEFTDYFVEQTKGRYPIALTDLQGPLDTAYLVWEPSAFMLAMYSNPKEVHHLMRLVTDLIIKWVKEERSRCPEFIPCHFPPLYLPDGRGISVSDDGLAVISANLYKEFCVPYMNELSEEFGGLVVHSCGNFVHQFANLEKIHNLRGINFGATETPFEAVWERFGGKTCVITHMGLNNEIHFEGNREFMEHVLGAKTHNRGLCILAAPGAMDLEMRQKAATTSQGALELPAIPRFVERVNETLAAYP